MTIHLQTSLRGAGAALAACALLALASCSKQAGNDAQGKGNAGAKIDSAVEKTQQQLSKAGERAKEEVVDAAGKTQETLSKAGERISAATAAAKADIKAGAPSSPPYSPRQPVDAATAPGASGAGATATPPTGDPATTTNMMSSGPSATVNILQP